jgi:hypothetical protein
MKTLLGTVLAHFLVALAYVTTAAGASCFVAAACSSLTACSLLCLSVCLLLLFASRIEMKTLLGPYCKTPTGVAIFPREPARTSAACYQHNIVALKAPEPAHKFLCYKLQQGSLPWPPSE